MLNRINLFINSLRGGGAERVLVTLANKFVEKGYEVRVLVLNLDNAVFAKDLDRRVNLQSLNVKHTKQSLIPLLRYFRKHDINTIVVFNHQLAIMVLLIKYLLRKDIKIIARNINTLSIKQKNEKSLWHRHVVYNLVKFFYKKIDHVICQSEGMANDLVKNFKISSNNISIVNNPVSMRFESLDKLRSDLPKRNHKEILFVGKLTKQKGLFYLLDAFNKICNTENQKIILRIVGDGPLLNQIDEYIKLKNLEKCVLLEGFSNNIEFYYEKADLTVLTSLYEGFPNVLVESLTFGVPVVAFDCPSGPKEIIEHGVNGYLVRYLDTNDLVKYIKLALNKKWNRLAIKKTAKKYSSDTIANKYLKIIKNYLGVKYDTNR